MQAAINYGKSNPNAKYHQLSAAQISEMDRKVALEVQEQLLNKRLNANFCLIIDS
ncbi:MAG: hypothetical protein EZS28_055781, partial [Streblomastix strix]